MNKKKLILGIVLGVIGVAILVAAIIGVSMLTEYNSKGAGSGETVTVEVEQGEGVKAIAAKLKEKGLIKSELVFYLKVKNMGVGGSLRYGTFELYKNAGLENLINDLISGGAQKESVMFTIPEGYSIEMIAAKLAEEGICTEDDFLDAVEADYDYWFLEDVPNDDGIKYQLQGFLFPDTYSVTEDMTAEDIVKMMLDQFDQKFTSDMREALDDSGKTVFELIIEASIIERETKIDSERVTVAGVIQNRLKIDMKLQMCPTALYPVTDGIYNKTTVTYDDIEIDSPYNTYKYAGLPVGPIANPGLESIEAALNPQEHDYLYYHTDPKKNDGSHIFTKTYQEHTNTQ